MSSSSSSSSSTEHAEKGIRLFGVELLPSKAPTSMRKSVSLGNLVHCGNVGNLVGSHENADHDGYLSDGLVHSNARSRRKGVPWSEDEHRAFLVGLQKLGKGDWRGISRSYVMTRTPTQVASHAQKYFIRQSNVTKRKRRSSLFDISPEMDTKFSELSSKKEVVPVVLPPLMGFKQEPVGVPLAKILEEKPYYDGNVKVEAPMLSLSLGLQSFVEPKVEGDHRLSLGLGLDQQLHQQQPSRFSVKLEQPVRQYCHQGFGNRFTSVIHCT